MVSGRVLRSFARSCQRRSEKRQRRLTLPSATCLYPNQRRCEGERRLGTMAYCLKPLECWRGRSAVTGRPSGRLAWSRRERLSDNAGRPQSRHRSRHGCGPTTQRRTRNISRRKIGPQYRKRDELTARRPRLVALFPSKTLRHISSVTTWCRPLGYPVTDLSQLRSIDGNRSNRTSPESATLFDRSPGRPSATPCGGHSADFSGGKLSKFFGKKPWKRH